MFLEALSKEAFRDVLQESARDEVRLDGDAFFCLPEAVRRRVIRWALRRLKGGLQQIEARHIKAAAALGETAATKVLQLPGGYEVRRSECGSIVIASSRLRIVPSPVAINVPGRFSLSEFGIVLEAELIDRAPARFSGDRNRECFDMGKVDSPLCIRSRQPGDRFYPLGMGHSKRLKEFFIDHKIPRNTRSTVPLLVCGQQIMWVIGHRIDERFKVTPDTTQILRVEVEPHEAPG
jgi:tRNA(Ile)-lysidine synthase